MVSQCRLLKVERPAVLVSEYREAIREDEEGRLQTGADEEQYKAKRRR